MKLHFLRKERGDSEALIKEPIIFITLSARKGESRNNSEESTNTADLCGFELINADSL
jgi:hypothetical protein